jgi:cholesterol transport system auxiliary component
VNHSFCKPLAVFAAALLTLTLPACSILPKPAAMATYKLPDHRPAGTGKELQPRDTLGALRIHAPESSRILDSDRVIIASADGRLSAWKGLRWSDPAPILLRDRLAEAFLRDGRMLVSVDADSSTWDLELIGALRAFQFEQRETGPVAVVRFDARLVDRTSLRIVANRRFDVVREVGSKQQTDVVSALGSASDTLAGQVIDWVVRSSVAEARQTQAPVEARLDALAPQTERSQ